MQRPALGRKVAPVRGLRVALALVALLLVAVPASASAARHHVLLVGTFHHHRGKYRSIQAAVNHAKPGDWVLVAPGVYHERADHRKNRGPQDDDTPAGVVI